MHHPRGSILKKKKSKNENDNRPHEGQKQRSSHLTGQPVLVLHVLVKDIHHLYRTETQTFVLLFSGLRRALRSSRRGGELLRRAREARAVAGQDPVAFLPPGAPLGAAQVPGDPLGAGRGGAHGVGHARPSQRLTHLRLNGSILETGGQRGGGQMNVGHITERRRPRKITLLHVPMFTG